MPPFPRVPGLEGEGPPEEGWGEEPPEEGWGDAEEDEGWGEAEEGEEDEEEKHVRIYALEDLAHLVDHPENYPNRDTVFVVEVPFREAPLMLELLRKAVEVDVGISFVGNFEELRQASDLHGALSRLSGSLSSLHKALRDDGGFDWAVVAAIENAPPQVAALCHVQPDNLRGSALQLLEGVEVMLRALPDKPATDAADASPKYPATLVTALISQLGRLLHDVDALLLGGLLLEYPEADAATFCALRKERGQEEEQQQQQVMDRYVVRIQGREDLNSIFQEPHKHFMQEHFSVVQLRFADAPSMLKDLLKATGKKGWWVGNLDRLQQSSELNASLSRVSRSLRYVQMGLGDKDIDWFELDSIRETTPKLDPLCELQPDNLRDAVLALIMRIEAMLGAFPQKPDNAEVDEEYPPDLLATLITRVGSLPADIDGLEGLIIQYPDAEAPPPSPPPQPRMS